MLLHSVGLRHRSWRNILFFGLVAGLASCGGGSADDASDDTTQDGSGGSADDGNTSATTPASTTDSQSGGSGGNDSAGTTAGDDTPNDTTAGADDGPTEPIIPDSPTPCGNTTYECGDTLDNDGDGYYDLWDPECIGPCDNDESAFQTGIPGDNMDCKQDCFFDGDSGSGNDGCDWDLTCDPSNPGAAVGCAYTGGMSCNNANPAPTQACIDFCGPLVPPGCDCFGCCEIELDDGSTATIFLNSGPECSIATIDQCQTCEQNPTCMTPCDRDRCELCFGQTEPPRGCGNVTCDNEMPCMQNSDCQTDWICQLGCCSPPPE
jgi:hypothetical protein